MAKSRPESPGFLVVARKLEEAATALSQSDTRKQLSDELNDTLGGGYNCYLCDVFGDDQSGDLVYSYNGNLWKCPYELSNVGGKRATKIETDQAVNVLPRTVYDEEADEADHMTAGEAARMLTNAMAFFDLEERFISKGERDSAGTGDFAGKGKSFPILKPADVMAAVRSMGRAGAGNKSTDALKSSIKRIAKKKGWTKYLPKAWQDDSAAAPTESQAVSSATPAADGTMKLVESAAFLDGVAVNVTEAAKADYAVKLIAPGWGSSGYYSPELLERDGPKIFKSGTHMHWNHPTAAEEAARPEGSLDTLAGVLTSNAYYDKSGKAGAGLYAKAKVFADYAQKVEEKAPHIGLSIRASGKAKEGEAQGRKGWIISELTHGESTDFVTRAGADGRILTEAARVATEGAIDMEKADIEKLIKEGITAAHAPLVAENRKLRERMALQDARGVIDEYFASVDVGRAIRERVTKRLLTDGTVPLVEATGELDAAKMKTLVENETKDEAAYVSRLTGGARVVGLGTVAAIDPKEAKRQDDKFAEAHEQELKGLAEIFIGEGDENKSMRKAFREGRAA